jgi:F420-dependent methylenetetrahydromethanopterin dehydrogenase
MRVVAACEPRYYREVVGETIQGLRPAVEVVIVDPEELADGLSHLDPDLVISVHPASLDPGGRAAWVEYVPYEKKPAATVSLGGRRQELEEMTLEDLLWVVDQADELSRRRKDLRNH